LWLLVVVEVVEQAQSSVALAVEPVDLEPAQAYLLMRELLTRLRLEQVVQAHRLLVEPTEATRYFLPLPQQAGVLEEAIVLLHILVALVVLAAAVNGPLVLAALEIPRLHLQAKEAMVEMVLRPPMTLRGMAQAVVEVLLL
jgi:hypothetical protein